MLRPSAPPRSSLSPKQRLALVHATSISTATILNMADGDISFDFVRKHRIPSHNLSAAGVTPLVLKARGASDASDLVRTVHSNWHFLRCPLGRTKRHCMPTAARTQTAWVPFAGITLPSRGKPTWVLSGLPETHLGAGKGLRCP